MPLDLAAASELIQSAQQQQQQQPSAAAAVAVAAAMDIDSSSSTPLAPPPQPSAGRQRFGAIRTTVQSIFGRSGSSSSSSSGSHRQQQQQLSGLLSCPSLGDLLHEGVRRLVASEHRWMDLTEQGLGSLVSGLNPELCPAGRVLLKPCLQRTGSGFCSLFLILAGFRQCNELVKP